MNNKDYIISNDNLGEIKISYDIFQSIAEIAIKDVEGVEKIVSTTPIEFVKKIGLKLPGCGVKSEIIDNKVKIDIPIIVKYGFNVLDISSKVQEKVKSSIQNITGIEVSLVNVKVVYITNE